MLKIGLAKSKITPKIPVDLSGYAGRQQPCLGFHDDIWVRTAVLEYAEKHVAISSIEVIGLDRDQTSILRRKLSANAWQPEELLFTCTHTHGSPALQKIRHAGDPSPEYTQELLETIVENVRQAGNALIPAEALISRTSCDLGINRRAPGVEGIMLSENPLGERDDELVLIHLREPGGKPLATLFNYACHGVVMGGDNRWGTGDWPGAAMRILEESHGGMALFLQGCCGDTNPRLRGTFDHVEQAGEMVAKAVKSAIALAQPIEEPRLDAISTAIDLPLMQPPSEEELRQRLGRPDGLSEVDIDWMKDTLDHPEGARRAKEPIETGEIRIGDAVIAWLPAEAFSSYSRAIKAARNPGKTMVAAYSNGNIGYLPNKQAFGEGGYEVTLAFKYYGSQMIGPECEELVLETFKA